MTFKKYTIIDWVVGFLGAFCILYFMFEDKDVLGIVLAFLWIGLTTLVCFIIERRKISSIFKELDEECRSDISLAKVKVILKSGALTKFGVLPMKFNLSSILIVNGDMEEGLEVLSEIEKEYIKDNYISEQIMLENNKAGAYLNLHDLESAEESINKIKSLQANKKMAKKMSVLNKKELEKHIEDKSHILNVLSGNIESEEKYFKESMQTAKKQSDKYIYKYYLALIFKQERKANEAVILFEDIAKNAGTLWIAKESKEKLGTERK